MILEGLVTTVNPDGTIRCAPMGPTVDAHWQRFQLRPFPTSRTLANLKRTGQGVLHVTDNVLLLASAAIDQFETVPATEPARRVEGRVLEDCCRWYEFRVTSLDESGQRAALQCQVQHAGRRRDFFGFCRAKHAVVEAAILATRVQFLPADVLRSELDRLEPLVHKTGDEPERRAFAMLSQYIQRASRAT